MFSNRKKKQQNKKLSERVTDFMIGQSNQAEQTESRDNMICRGTSSDNASNPTQINPHKGMYTDLRKILLVKCEVKRTMS